MTILGKLLGAKDDFNLFDLIFKTVGADDKGKPKPDDHDADHGGDGDGQHQAGDNLIVNGDFENYPALQNGDWGYLNSVSGWHATKGEVEIQSGDFGTGNSAGNAVAELDSSRNSTIQQVVTVEEAGVYEFSLDYAMRDNDPGTNGFAVYINGVEHASVYPDEPGFKTLAFEVALEAGPAAIALTALGKSDSYGTVIDNVSLRLADEAKDDDPEFAATHADAIVHRYDGQDDGAYHAARLEDGEQFASAVLLHGADGAVVVTDGEISHNGDTVAKFSDASAGLHFIGRAENGDFLYASQGLTQSDEPAFELKDSDIDFLLKQSQLGVVDPSQLADITDPSGIRLLDGFGNNVNNPTWGKADEPFLRWGGVNYEDGVGEPRQGPNPRDISNAVHNQNTQTVDATGPGVSATDKDIPNNFLGNELVSAFGQYFDHGLDFVPKGQEVMPVGNDSFPLSINRGLVNEGTGENGAPRQHNNLTSPFADQNQAYGSNEAILEFLLERNDAGELTARLLTGYTADGVSRPATLGELKANWQKGVDAGVVPQFEDGWISDFRGSGDPLLLDINPGVALDDHLVAGDGRINENIGLTSVHTIFANNHNFWVDAIAKKLEELADAGTPRNYDQEDLFNMAKIVNEGEYQRIVFDEFVELLVGSDVHAFRDYNPQIDASISHEFAAAAFRLGHSMLNNYITVQNEDGSTSEFPLFNAFLNPGAFQNLGASSIIGGSLTSLHQEIDPSIVSDLRNNLLGQPLDLASFNIGRGRDLGIETLNGMREAVGLSKYSDWESFAGNMRNPSDVEKFKQVYDSVDDVDLWSGGLAEKASSANGLGVNTVLGETFTWVFSIQMIAIQDGDRFYYKHRLFETNLRQEIQNQDFADVIERTLDLDHLGAEVLTRYDERIDLRESLGAETLKFEGDGDREIIIGRNFGETIDGGAGDDTIFGEAGSDLLLGKDGDDALHGGDGDDILIGHDGDDRFDGGKGNDRAEGGLGDDDMAGNAGDDILNAGEGDDEAFGGDGDDRIDGGSGWDNLWGGYGDDIVKGGSGRDQLSGGHGNDRLDGGSGDDRIIGSEGDDDLTGGEGYDVFQFLPGSGSDIIRDFSVSEDQIDLHRYVWEYGSDAVNADSLRDSLVDAAEGARLTLPGAASILFEGVSADSLRSAGDGIFILEAVVDQRSHLQRQELARVMEIDVPSIVSVSGKDGRLNDNRYDETIDELVTTHHGFDDGSFDTDLALDKKSDFGQAVYADGKPDKEGLFIQGVDSDDRLALRLHSQENPGVDGPEAPVSTYFAVAARGDGADALAMRHLLATPRAFDDGASDLNPNGVTVAIVRDASVFTGTKYDDVFVGSQRADVFYAGKGDDEAGGGDGDDMLVGGDGDDRLDGGAGDDGVYGGDGADVLYGGAGDDDIAGDEGDDALDGGKGDDGVFGGAGDDILNGGDGDDLMAGDAGKDVMSGDEGDDALFGGDHDDRLFGGAGDDELVGERGDDRLEGGEGKDALYGGADDDSLDGGAGDDVLAGESGKDRLAGGEGADTLYGDGDNDVLLGEAGDDRLYAGDGNDVLDGGAGDDLMNGGAGKDVFQFTFGGGHDVISDFEQGIDIIQLLGFAGDFDDLSIHAVGHDLRVDLSGGADSVTLSGYAYENLGEKDFAFGY